MLPKYLALCICQFVCFVKKYLCVRSLGYIVGGSPHPCENMCVRLLGYIVGASHLCVSIQLLTL